MLNANDKKDIRKIVKEEVGREVEERTTPLRRSLVEIEKDRKILRDIWLFVKDHTTKIEDHAERITQLETSQKI